MSPLNLSPMNTARQVVMADTNMLKSISGYLNLPERGLFKSVSKYAWNCTDKEELAFKECCKFLSNNFALIKYGARQGSSYLNTLGNLTCRYPKREIWMTGERLMKFPLPLFLKKLIIFEDVRITKMALQSIKDQAVRFSRKASMLIIKDQCEDGSYLPISERDNDYYKRITANFSLLQEDLKKDAIALEKALRVERVKIILSPCLKLSALMVAGFVLGFGARIIAQSLTGV